MKNESLEDAAPDLLNEATEFMLKEHKLYFSRIENLNVGMNFVESVAKFARQQEPRIRRDAVAEFVRRVLKRWKAHHTEGELVAEFRAVAKEMNDKTDP
jgi:hypothetical protein